MSKMRCVFAMLGFAALVALACTKQSEPQANRTASGGPAGAAATRDSSPSLPSAPGSKSPSGDSMAQIDFKGWILQVVRVNARRERLFINEPTFSFGDAKPGGAQGTFVYPKDRLWLVTISAVRHGGEDIWARDVALIDEQGRKTFGLGGTTEGAHVYLKGMGINESGTYIIVFNVRANAGNSKLQLIKGSPMLPLPPPVD
jgi:hypothetical protein